MEKAQRKEIPLSRRSFLTGTGVFMAGGALGLGASLAPAADSVAGTAPPLPWKGGKLDPLEAGSLAYRYYLDLGG